MKGKSPHRPGKDYLMILKDSRGYTLTEMIIAMAIFVIVMMVANKGFQTMLTHVGQQSKLSETQIGNVIGLELLRSDLQNAGYGLPWTLQDTPSASYTEMTNDDHTMPATAWEALKSPMTYNDAPGAPRFVQSGNTTFNAGVGGGSQYLVIKSLSVAPWATQKKWITVTYGTTTKTASNWGSAERAFAANSTERVIVVRSTFVSGVPIRELQVNDGVFAAPFNEYTTLTQPHSSGCLSTVPTIT